MCECWQKRPERPDPPLNNYKSDLWDEAEIWDAMYAKRDKTEAEDTWEALSKNYNEI